MNALSTLRVLYIGLKYDYGIPERGLSYEYLNFLDTLRRMPDVAVDFFPFDEVMREGGRKQMNKRLLEASATKQYDVYFFVLFTDEIKRETIQYISKQSGSVALNWFGDDHWRFSTFSKFYAPYFHWILTTDSRAVERYHAIGCRNVIKTQWAFNDHLYKKCNIAQDLDVTFVGQVHSHRKRIVDELMKAGIMVQCWGKGWSAGRLSHEEMIQTYSRSRINLNFTESSVVFGAKPLAKVFVTRRADDSMRLNSPREIAANVGILFGNRFPQIKGRNFEIPGAGGFLLTSRADNLEHYFVPGKEIAIFENVPDLIGKIRHYLEHDEEREQIRMAGYERARREHTYEIRFREIFRAIGYEKV